MILVTGATGNIGREVLGRVVGVAIGRPLQHVVVPDAAARAGMVRWGMPEVMADAVLELMRPERSGRSHEVSHTVEQLTGQPARRFAEWARDHAAAFGGPPGSGQ